MSSPSKRSTRPSVIRSRAAGVRAASSSTCQGRDGPEGAAGGASSSTACTLVPPMPNALTPARRGSPFAVQSVSRSATRNGLAAKSMAGFGVAKCRLGGIWRCSRASTALIRPVTPAAASRWPTLVLTEPREQKPVRPVRLSEGLGEGGDLDGIAERCARCRAPRRSRCSPERPQRRRAPRRWPSPDRRRSARCSPPCRSRRRC